MNKADIDVIVRQVASPADHGNSWKDAGLVWAHLGWAQRVRSCLAGIICLLSGVTPAAAQSVDLRLDQLQILGSHNSYRPYPSPVIREAIQSASARAWPLLAYGHPPLESQLELGLRQFELDVAPDPQGGRYLRPYEAAGKEVRTLMSAPGAKILHSPVNDYETHCLTLRTCLEIFRRWSEAHQGHDPVVILINARDFTADGPSRPAVRFDAAGLDALDEDIRSVMGSERLITPDNVRGNRASLREAVRAGLWPRLEAAKGRFVFILDGSAEHANLYRENHPSLAGRVMFAWYGEEDAEASAFNIQDPVREEERIRRLVREGFLVRTRADSGMAEARSKDRGRMAAAIRSGAQLVSTDLYPGVPDPEGLRFVQSFEGPYVRCNAVTARCP